MSFSPVIEQALKDAGKAYARVKFAGPQANPDKKIQPREAKPNGDYNSNRCDNV